MFVNLIWLLIVINVCWISMNVFYITLSLIWCFCVSRFGSDKGKLTRKITKIFKNKFNGQYYSWTVVPRRRQERWFVEFAVELFSSRLRISTLFSLICFLISTFSSVVENSYMAFYTNRFSSGEVWEDRSAPSQRHC